MSPGSAGPAGSLRLWLEYKLRRKLRKRYARIAAAVLQRAQRIGIGLGFTPAPVVISRYGVRMRANWRDTTFQYCYFATYGRFLSDLLARQRTPFVFLDIGANQGLYSLLAARNPHCVAALALEPVPSTFGLLLQNIAENGAGGRVIALQVALSDRAGDAQISVREAHSGTATLSRGINYDAAHTQTVQLIDVAMLDESIPGTAPILVKVDVEGHEDVVIAALMRSRHVARMRAIFYEVDVKWSDPAPLQAALRAAGYSNFMRLGMGKHYDVLATRAPAEQ